MQSVVRRSLAPLVNKVSVVLSALVLTACTVGPNFKPPDAPRANGGTYTPAPIPQETVAVPGAAGAAQRFAIGEDISAQWWRLFQSDALDQLIRASLTRSPTLAAAQASLRQAQETLTAQTGSLLYPNVSAQLGVTREKAAIGTVGPGVGNIFTLYNAAVDVSYTLDVFGGARRQIEGFRAAVEFQRYQLEAAYLSLTSNLVTAAVTEASLRAQIESTRAILVAQEQQLNIMRKQFSAGAIARSNVLVQQTQVAQTRATLPPLENALAQIRHQLSVYAGRLPSESGMPEFQLASLQLPRDLPVSLPSALVRQRPDIQASEALLHEASALIGVATANLYPQITLSGSLGSEALQASNLFGAGTGVWSIGAGLLQPLFNGGALTARRRAAIAAYDQAAAQYQSTILTAFQNVADSLRALELDAETLKAVAEAEASASESLDLATRQYKLGAVSYLILLDAQRAYHQTRVALVRAQADRFSATAALFQSLGGGWWNRESLTDISRTLHD
jgi:NodT family efflux transporter outer membrane factor (OMF) lipoprotein